MTSISSSWYSDRSAEQFITKGFSEVLLKVERFNVLWNMSGG